MLSFAHGKEMKSQPIVLNHSWPHQGKVEPIQFVEVRRV